MVLGGTVGGGGAIGGDLVNSAGTVAPGISPGILAVGGDYTQMTTGELLIELAASSYDQLLVTDTATLDGTLTVDFLDGFIPDIGQTFTILTANDVDFKFTTDPVSPVPGLIFDVIYNSQSVVLSILPEFSADFDLDRDVDGDDLAQWEADYGLNGDSDADNDGDSDGADFLAWQQQFGSGVGPLAASQAVPEPPGTLLGLSAALGLLNIFECRARTVARRSRLLGVVLVAERRGTDFHFAALWAGDADQI